MAIHPTWSSTSMSPAAEPEIRHDNPACHAYSPDVCFQILGTSLQGLSEAEAESRRGADSQRSEPVAPDRRQVFLGGFKSRVSWLFLAASGLSFYMAQPVDGILILVAMLANGGIQGLIQWKSLRNRQTVEEVLTTRCVVRRDGREQTIDASELVPGDILLIQGGRVIPADARLISSYEMQVDESLLTGESVSVHKNANILLHPAEDVTAQCNMVFAGTMVKTGKGEAVVTALGVDTIMGRVATLAADTEKRESPFTKRLNQLSLRIFLMVAVLTAVVLAVGYTRGIPLPQLIQIGLIMSIAAFPETLPGLASLILSMGINRLGDRKVLVKSFQALEGIGDVTVVCTDKTGTLTENYLTVDKLCLPGLGVLPYDPKWQKGEDFPSASVEMFLRIGRLNNGTVLEGLRSPLMGDPIDVALYRAAPASLEGGYHQRLTIPFDPVKLRSATLCEGPDKRMVSMIKGAPEAVMEICRYYLQPDGSVAEMTIGQRSEFLLFNRKLASEHNLRVIGFACKPLADDQDTEPYADAVFVGWAALLDPAKPGVVDSIAHLQGTGAAVVMITGDQKATAEMTAQELGIIRRASDEVWLRLDLESAESERGPGIPDTVKVFARTRPEEKLAIVESLQRSGRVVAMVGDGVNDSPALQKSDVAIAMGLQGSEAAKNSADIILLNDRLEGIMLAILESRVLRRKIQACMRYLLSCSLGLILFVAASILFGPSVDNLPITVVQMLWLELVIVSVPALVLAIEPVPESELTPAEPAEEKPGSFKAAPVVSTEPDPSRNPMDRSRLFLVFFWACMMSVAGLGTYFLGLYVLKWTPDVSATAAFCSLALAQTFNLFNVQVLNAGENRKAFTAELSGTPITWIVIVVGLLLQGLTVYVPAFNMLIGTTPLSAQEALTAASVSLAVSLFTLKTMKI